MALPLSKENGSFRQKKNGLVLIITIGSLMIFLSLDHFIFFYDLNHLIKTGEVRALKA
jgi:hypothetical protein